MTASLLNLAPVANGSFLLAPDSLGDAAYAAVSQALQLDAPAVLTACATTITPTANLLAIEGTLAEFPGYDQPTQVRLYLFEVPSLFGFTERHAILLWDKMPVSATPTVRPLLAPFSGDSTLSANLPAELDACANLDFAPNTSLLFSTLDYTSPNYLNPPFPPENDPSAPQAFLTAIQSYLVQGYVFEAAITLNDSLTIQPPATAPSGTEAFTLDLSTVLGTLGLGGICSTGIPVTAQLLFPAAGVRLNLLYPVNATAASLPLSPSFTAVGIGIQLGSGAPQIPLLELDGSLLINKNPLDIRATFDPAAMELSAVFSDFPTLDDLLAHFQESSGPSSADSVFGGFLPQGCLNDLGTLTIGQLGLSIDCEGLSVDALSVTVFTEHALPLFDGVKFLPALLARFTDPFESYRSAEVDVAGKWFHGSSELDAVLMVDTGGGNGEQITFMAQLALGSGVDFDALAATLFHGQVAGLPSLVLSDIELYAQKAGDGSESLAIDLEVNSGWNIDGVPIALDDLSLNIALRKDAAQSGAPTPKWALAQAGAQCTLEVGSAFFNLSAEYDGNAKGWSFSGGTLPNTSLKLSDFLAEVATDLGLSGVGHFLDDFADVTVESCYVQYQTAADTSPYLQLILSTDFTPDSPTGKGLALGDVVFKLVREGGGTRIGFDATPPTTPALTLDEVLTHFGNDCGLTLSRPGCLDSDMALQSLSAAHNSAADSFHFDMALTFSTSALLLLHIDVFSQTLAGTTTKTSDFGGQLIINQGETDELQFDIDFVESAGTSTLVASFHADSPQSIDIGSLIGALDASLAGDLPSFTIDIKDALFARNSANGSARSLFAVDMGAAVGLSKLDNLPLIGHELASMKSLDLAFQVLYASSHYKADELQAINTALGSPSFCFPAQDIPAKETKLSTQMRLGNGESIHLSVPVSLGTDGTLTSQTGGGQITPTSPNTSNASSTGAGGNVTWFPIGKSFGPVRIDRVGLSFKSTDTSITGYLDGDISVAALTFELLGLNVSIPLTGASRFIPTFGIEGLGLEYQNAPVEIGGALIKMQNNGAVEFDGFITVSTEKLQLGALGSYAEMNDGHKSLFVYAVVGDPIGGPPFFFVTGLVAGFGFNRKLLAPTLTEIPQFPLVAEAVAPSPMPAAGDLSGVRDYVAAELALMSKAIVPADGENFLAAGVKFTSYSLVNGVLLAAVPTGSDFRVDVFGLANALLPPDDASNPVAEAQLALIAHFVPSEGMLWVQGQLTPNSYILSSACHLTGGFAFVFWSDGAHAGQFVVTIGGYHPGYHPPAYFPLPPRVGFNWQVSSHLTVKGGGYFALVPHALMAGGALSAVFQAGSFRAWYMMDANFLIEWKPFHYEATLYVDLGCELVIHLSFFGTFHVSIDVSANLNLWGPEFGGHAEISVHVICVHIHIGISFGASAARPKPLTWQEFESTFLPTDTNKWLGLSIQGGLLRTVVGTLPDGTTGEIWIVKRDRLDIATNSLLPVIEAAFQLDGNTAATPTMNISAPGIAPMDVASITQSTHTITITKVSPGVSGGSAQATTAPKEAAGTGADAAPTEQLALQPIYKNVPSGMWGHRRKRPLNPAPGEDIIVSVSGFSITPSQTCNDDPDALVVARSSLAYETTEQCGFAWVTDTGSVSGQPAEWSAVSAAIGATAPTRLTLLDALGFQGFQEQFNQPLGRDALIEPQLVSF